jgi:hypothetical protein
VIRLTGPDASAFVGSLNVVPGSFVVLAFGVPEGGTHERWYRVAMIAERRKRDGRVDYTVTLEEGV